MTDASYSSDLPDRLAQALTLCRTLHRDCVQYAAAVGPNEDLDQLLAAFDRLLEMMANLSSEYEHQGRLVLTRIQMQAPEVWTRVDRELLWFFGGDCLHYLSDEEIAAFQARADQL